MFKRDFWLDELQIKVNIDDLHYKMTLFFESEETMYCVLKLLQEMDKYNDGNVSGITTNERVH